MGRVAASAAPASASAATRAAPAAKSAKTTHECTPAPGSSLLPSDISDFRRREYWASFFDKCGGKAFEWYGSWKHFEGNVDAALAGVAPREACDMAVIGCGNSDMSRAAWSAGYKRITNMDYEPGVIARMQAATAKSCPGMKWMVQDASAMRDVDSASFHAVLDKGTLDAMTPDEGVDTTAGVVAMFGEVARILRPGGKYMIITLAQDHVARTLLQHATSTAADAWSAIDVATFAQPDMSSAACQFFITLTRAGDSGAGTASSTADAASSGRGAVRVHVPLTFEVTDNEEAAAKSATRRKRGKGGAHAAGVSSRLPVDTLCFPTTAPNCVSATLDAVHDIQWSFSTFQTLSSIAPGHYERVDVWCLPGRTPIITPAGAKSPFATGTAAGADTDVFHSVPRFSITVVDGSLAPSAGVLLVPQGREHEWSFSNVEGQNKLLKSVPYGRLLFVCMNRGHTFASQKAVQEELSPIVVMLVPPHVRAGASMPFLAVASDIGRREIVARGSTACSGDYVIEDVEEEDDEEEEEAAVSGGGGSSGAAAKKKGKQAPAAASAPPPVMRRALRRLIFMSNQNAVQTEVVVRRAAAGAAPTLQLSNLTFEYQQAIVAAFALTRASVPTSVGDAPAADRVLVLGLGGGTLPTFLHAAFPAAAVAVAELDPEVVTLAANHYGFPIAPPRATSLEELTSGSADAPALWPAPNAAGCRVVVGDGFGLLSYLGEEARTDALRPTFLVVDVDAKVLSGAISFPPPSFFTRPNLACAFAALAPGGVMVVNFACRSAPLRAAVMAAMSSIFGEGNVSACDLASDDSVNSLLVARKAGAAGSGAAAAHSVDDAAALRDCPAEGTFRDATARYLSLWRPALHL